MKKKKLKILILWLARTLGLFYLGRFLTGRGIMIIGWHGVSLIDEHKRFRSLFISPETFRRRLSYIKTYFKVIGIDDAVEQLKRGAIREKNQIVLTFDDGYYNFISIAAPILKEYGFTATVYMVSGFMEKQKPFHNLVVRDIILRSECGQFNHKLVGIPSPFFIKTEQDRQKLRVMALAHLKKMPPHTETNTRDQYIKELAIAFGVDIEHLLADRIWHSLNEEETSRLLKDGFSMELHGHLHRMNIPYSDALYDDVRMCQIKVEKAKNKSARHYCYPGGLWSKKSWGIFQKIGVLSAATTRLGPNLIGTPLLGLRRFLDGEDRHQLEFEFELSNLRWLFWVLFHPSNIKEPTEKLVKYRKDGTLF